MSAPVVGIATRDGRLAVTFTRDGKLEGWAYFDELSYEARDTFLAALEIQKKNDRGKIDLGKIAQELPPNDPFSRARCRAIARVAMARQLGLKAECVHSGTDGHPLLVLEVPETIPQDKRIQDWLTVHFVGVEAEKQIYGSYSGDGNGEIGDLAEQFHLDNGHLLDASPRATRQPKRYGFEGVDVSKVAEELRATAPLVQASVQQDKEAALNQPYHLFFFSAVDRNARARFFDVMKHEDGFSIAETATSAPRLAECVETVYGNPGGRGTHHLHRNYGEYPMATARQTMEHFASFNGLTQVAQIAETRTLREAGPIWKLVYGKLGCVMTALNQTSVSDHQGAGSHARSQSPQSGRILVVHHERVIAEVICKILAHQGYESRMECSSSEAIAKALEWMPQLLIIDPVMPGVSGVVAAKEICGQIECKVLLINAAAREPEFAEVVNNLRNNGCDCEAFPLPFEKEDLLEHVRQRVRPAPEVVRTDPIPLDSRVPSPAAECVHQRSTSTSGGCVMRDYRTYDWKRYSSAHGAFLRCITFGVRKDLPEDHPDQPMMCYQRRCEEVDRIVAEKGCPDEEDLRRWAEEDNRGYDERENLLETTKASSSAPPGSVTGDSDNRLNAHALSLKACPSCGREVLSLITDNKTSERYCYHCIPNPESCPGAVYVTRKMDELNSAGKLDTYPVEQRMKDLNNPPRCSECGALSESELCSKCEGEFFMLAHRQRPANERPSSPDSTSKAPLGAVPKTDLVQPRVDGEAKNRATTIISLETIDALLKSANVVTRMEQNSLMFKGFIGETWVEISPSGFRTPDGLEVSEIIRMESVLDKMPVTWNDGLLCAVNMAASNGALTVDSDGKLRIRSRMSLFSGEPREVLDVYVGIVFLGSMIHTNAVQASIVDAWHLPISKAEPLPDSDLDGVWGAASFERTLSMMRKAGIFANGGDASGLTAEFPWDPDAFSAVETLIGKRRKRTSLLRMECMEHPNLGKGVFCRLDLPLDLKDDEAFRLAIELNKMEFTAADWPPFLGAWTSKPGSGRPTFVSFWPNCFAKIINLELMATWLAARAQRVPEWVRSNTGFR